MPTDLDEDFGADIAIVGLAGRFPDAPDLATFWRHLCEGHDALRRFDDASLRAQGVPPELLVDPAYVKAGVVLDGIETFDAAYFGFTAREAERLDPQQRVFLETAAHALQHAGYDGPARPPRTGVFAGCGANQYVWRHLLPAGVLAEASALPALLNGNDKDALALRTAYLLDLRGPALTVQTACSTSLVAVHLACQALLNHEADLALAGGVALNLAQHQGYLFQPGGIRSPDGRCRAFDAEAAGTLSGSGAAVVVLKRLAQALADRDTVHAVIKGSAVNNDGAGKVGYTAPSLEGQARAIVAAQRLAGVASTSIDYVEAHGTGTALGDPIELAALNRAFAATAGGRPRRAPCALGSLKTAIGHLDAAAGVAGLVKATLALRHATLPPSLHFRQPHPAIEFGAFEVNPQARPWPRGEAPRRAGVSAFGMGGTNAHLVLEEAPAEGPLGQGGAPAGWQLLPVSARSAVALQRAQAELDAALAAPDAPSVDDAAHTLQTGRRSFAHRSVRLVPPGAAPAAAPWLAATQAPAQSPEVVFLFPGQGAQHVGMARALYLRHAGFREALDDCASRLQPRLGLDLRALLFPAAADEHVAAETLAQTAITQPALFAVEWSLAQLWMRWGVQPALMLGHSVGEYVAACVAGVFSLDDALALIAERGRLMQALPPGAMSAVALGEAALPAHVFEEGLSLAAVNAPNLCVLAGEPAAIARMEQRLQAEGVVARRLQVSHAFHSALMAPALAGFEAALGRVALSPPRLPFVSNVTGQLITAEDATRPAYWLRHLRDTVRFAQGLDTVLARPGRVLLEVGPGEVLSGLARRHPQAPAAQAIVSSQPHPREAAAQGEAHALQALGRLWMAGVPVDFTRAAGEGARPRRVPLPGYPFERQRYWVDAPAPGASALAVPPRRAAGEWFERLSWQRAEALAEPVGAAGGLLLLGEGPFAAGLAAGLAADGFRVHHAPQAGADGAAPLAAALQAAARACGPLRHVVHLGALPAVPEDDDAAALQTGLHALVALAQAMQIAGPAVWQAPLRITVLASQLEDITGTEPLHPAKAAVRGPCGALPQEWPGVEVQLIDALDPADDAGAQARLVAQVRRELGAASPAALLALRGPHRWQRVVLPAARPAGPSALRRGGVYLITGGLGGMGLALAEHLARAWQARLVLVGRSSGRTPAQQAVLDRLDALGTEWLACQADVADTAQLRAVLAEARARFGAVHGLIHAAGVAGGGVMAQRAPEAVAAVLSPKLGGARALVQAWGDAAPPDFLLHCSSLAAAIGAFGDADYAAANAGLDAHAQALRRRGWPAWSLLWDTWREVGMAAHRAPAASASLSPQEGAQALEQALAGPPATLLVSPQGLAAKQAAARSLDFGDELAALASPATTATGAHARPALAVPFEAPQGELEHALAEGWQAALGFAGIGRHDSLFELGGDSLTALQLLAQVRQRFGVTLHPGELFQRPSVAGLASLIELRLIEQIHTEAPASPS